MAKSKSDCTVGDIIRITRYMLGRMYENPTNDMTRVGKEAVVVSVQRSTYGSAKQITCRQLLSGEQETLEVYSGHEDFEYVRTLDGPVVPGVTFPWTERELINQRWAAFLQKLEGFDHSHQGFSNPATFLAWLYLKNDAQACGQLKSMQRKDGTVSTAKVHRLFSVRRFKVDDWALECPIDVPAEFQNWVETRKGRAVCWAEVAHAFRKGD